MVQRGTLKRPILPEGFYSCTQLFVDDNTSIIKADYANIRVLLDAYDLFTEVTGTLISQH